MYEVSIPGEATAGMQIFRAETESELIDELAKAQSHATRLIRKQAKQIETLRGMLAECLASAVINNLTNKT